MIRSPIRSCSERANLRSRGTRGQHFRSIVLFGLGELGGRAAISFSFAISSGVQLRTALFQAPSPLIRKIGKVPRTKSRKKVAVDTCRALAGATIFRSQPGDNHWGCSDSWWPPPNGLFQLAMI